MKPTACDSHCRIVKILRMFLDSLAVSVAIIVLCGCVTEQESLHELDHEVPSHWPANMEDAAVKIEQRLLDSSAEAESAVARSELLDLIEWAPEIAADTDLTEADWLPVYELSEALRKHLRAGDVTVGECHDDLERLAMLLRELHAKGKE